MWYHQGLCDSVRGRSGDWLYQAVEVSSLILVGVSIYLTVVSSYNKKLDKFGNNKYIPDEFGIVWLLLPALVLALVCSALQPLSFPLVGSAHV